ILFGYPDIHLSRKTPKLNASQDITISSFGCHDITFIKGTNLDKKRNLCLLNLPIIQGPCR
ncbi:hypothetical protein J1N35_034837, partial [Gossypium stocksii]